MLGHVALIYILIAANCLISGGEVVPIRVNGLINQSVLLSPSQCTSHHVQEVFWNYQSHIMASFIHGRFVIKKNGFKGRLEILDDGRALRIGQLTLNDSGRYTVTITFMDNTNLDASYKLIMYEPVPTPSMKTEAMEKTINWCNVTLRCSIPRNTSSLSYTWKYRHGDSDYQLYNNSGDTLQMSLQPEFWDMEVLCIVHNPADQKNVSLAKFCRKDSEKDKQIRGYYGFVALLLLLLVLVFLGWYFLKMKKKRRKAETPAVPENMTREAQYIQVTTLPPNDDKQVWNNKLYDSSPRQNPKAVTVYAVLEHPMQKR